MSSEHTNYTYHPTEHNRRQLAHFISLVLSADVRKFEGYLDEVVSDSELRQHIGARTAASRCSFGADEEPRYGQQSVAQ